MKHDDIIETIHSTFHKAMTPARVPLIRHGYFEATADSRGIQVSNLANQPFLPWSVFVAAVDVIQRNSGRALRGNAMGNRLGEPGLPLESVEGHIAHTIYGRPMGAFIFRRIVPVACTLIWANICRHEPGYLVLVGPN